jgi:hypothetical protein
MRLSRAFTDPPLTDRSGRPDKAALLAGLRMARRAVSNTGQATATNYRCPSPWAPRRRQVLLCRCLLALIVRRDAGVAQRVCRT